MTEYEKFMQDRVNSAIINSSEGTKALKKDLDRRIKEKRRELIKLKAKTVVNRIGNYVDESLNKKVVNRAVIRKDARATVVVNQSVYDRDKSRFFKDTWEEERRQLFFR